MNVHTSPFYQKLCVWVLFIDSFRFKDYTKTKATYFDIEKNQPRFPYEDVDNCFKDKREIRKRHIFMEYNLTETITKELHNRINVTLSTSSLMITLRNAFTLRIVLL